MPAETEFINHRSSITEQFADYDPKHLASLSVTLMIRTIAQMKNARRGHDAQGRLKKVKLDESNEGYANFMAPMRMERIRRQVEKAEEEGEGHGLREVYTDKVLKPATDTYLTAEWDEMVPFPESTYFPFFLSHLTFTFPASRLV